MLSNCEKSFKNNNNNMHNMNNRNDSNNNNNNNNNTINGSNLKNNYQQWCNNVAINLQHQQPEMEHLTPIQQQQQQQQQQQTTTNWMAERNKLQLQQQYTFMQQYNNNNNPNIANNNNNNNTNHNRLIQQQQQQSPTASPNVYTMTQQYIQNYPQQQQQQQLLIQQQPQQQSSAVGNNFYYQARLQEQGQQQQQQQHQIQQQNRPTQHSPYNSSYASSSPSPTHVMIQQQRVHLSPHLQQQRTPTRVSSKILFILQIYMYVSNDDDRQFIIRAVVCQWRYSFRWHLFLNSILHLILGRSLVCYVRFSDKGGAYFTIISLCLFYTQLFYHLHFFNNRNDKPNIINIKVSPTLQSKSVSSEIKWLGCNLLGEE